MYQYDFAFENERINNSPYVMVKDKKRKNIEIVREGMVSDAGFVRNRVIDFERSSPRPDFVK